jgi:SWI/SNF-related matrix-associated actin-dependent regulator 1 of chromatin subfamily A
MGNLDRFKGAVFDEAHYLKNPKSQRTQAAAKINASIAQTQVMMFLTGTPVLNRPIEIIEPLVMLGILADEADGTGRMTRQQFKSRYCWDGEGYGGSRYEAELGKFLRSTCMVRRTKDQVLSELPAKQRVDNWIDLDEVTRKRYEQAAREGLAAAQGSNAAAIVYVNTLRQLAGHIKADLAVDWAKDFLATTDKKLVIFAHHIPVQQGIIRRLTEAGYQVGTILGGASTDQVEADKDRFMTGDVRVMVCSTKAAGVGHTLTAASDVLMVEQSWTPADHWQAEDRLHRIGQDKSVTCHYLMLADSIDTWSYALIEGKANTINAIMNSDTGEVEMDSIMTRFLAAMADRYAPALAA